MVQDGEFEAIKEFAGIIILVTSPLPTKLPSFEVELQTGAKSSYSLFRPHLVKEVLLLSGSKQMIY